MKIFLKTLVICLLIYGFWYLKSAYFETSYMSKIPSKIETTQTQETVITPKKTEDNKKEEEPVIMEKSVKVYFLDKNGGYVAAVRKTSMPSLEFAIRQLLKGPSEGEKKAGYFSEIPTSTKLISITDSKGKIIINLSSAFEYGGGTESIINRIHQLVRTANENSDGKPIYLFLDGKQVDMIGGEGIMIEQPLKG